MNNNEINNQLTEQDKQESHNILAKDEVSRDEITKLMNSKYFNKILTFINSKTQQTKINLLLLGATGAGKSSLINRMFGKEILKVNHTRPETRGIGDATNTVETDTFRFYDSEGYEIGGEEKFKNNIDSFLRQKQNNKSEFPHCVIYCLQIAKPRIEDIDLQTIRLVKESYKLPVIIALTKFDTEKKGFAVSTEFKRILTSNGVNENEIFTLTEKNQGQDYDQMKQLVDCLGENLDKYMAQQKTSMLATADHTHIEKEDEAMAGFESLRNFKPSDELYSEVASEYVTDEKRKKAKSRKIDHIIYMHTGVAMGAAAIPLPVADAVALIAVQTSLARSILKEYNIVSEGIVNDIIDIVPGLILTTLGKKLAFFALGEIMKFFPQFGGSFVGGAVNVTVASALTFAFGKSLKIVCENLDKQQNLNSINDVLKVMEEIGFVDIMKTMFNQKQTELKNKNKDK